MLLPSSLNTPCCMVYRGMTTTAACNNAARGSDAARCSSAASNGFCSLWPVSGLASKSYCAMAQCPLYIFLLLQYAIKHYITLHYIHTSHTYKQLPTVGWLCGLQCHPCSEYGRLKCDRMMLACTSDCCMELHRLHDGSPCAAARACWLSAVHTHLKYCSIA